MANTLIENQLTFWPGETETEFEAIRALENEGLKIKKP